MDWTYYLPEMIALVVGPAFIMGGLRSFKVAHDWSKNVKAEPWNSNARTVVAYRKRTGILFIALGMCGTAIAVSLLITIIENTH